MKMEKREKTENSANRGKQVFGSLTHSAREIACILCCVLDVPSPWKMDPPSARPTLPFPIHKKVLIILSKAQKLNVLDIFVHCITLYQEYVVHTCVHCIVKYHIRECLLPAIYFIHLLSQYVYGTQ